ncbi:glycosyltransferase [Roseospira visakhapatnamensis]|uniref:Rhamnosyltransferase n=1 Tax=Roseospira visakhapatnamensis TaxID=390880 RepID=A0A7W6W8U8_9PROT|nr:rhamnosyltransferase [Roseospira visakhapatnamensis]
MTPAPTSRVLAIIVTYHPEPTRLTALVARIRPQVSAVLVVDNGSALPPGWLESLGVTTLALGRNTGVAGALNRGIAHLMAGSWSHALTLDQDSVPAPDMVARLLEAESRLMAEGVPLAAVGPVHVDPRTGVVAVSETFRGLRRVWAIPESDGVLEVNHLITSGMLVHRAALEAVGPMREALFIDYVDIDWCVRAQGLGRRLIAVGAARMDHTIGDAVIRVRSLGGFSFKAHSPLRDYFIARNGVAMLRHPHGRLGWKLAIAKDVVVRNAVFWAFQGHRLTRMGRIAQGIWHGLIGRLGPPPP